MVVVVGPPHHELPSLETRFEAEFGTEFITDADKHGRFLSRL